MRRRGSQQTGKPAGGRLFMAQASAFHARVDAAQLEETVASGARASVVPLLASVLIAVAFWETPRRNLLLVLLALVSSAAGAAVVLARRARRRRPLRAGARRGVAAGAGLAVGLAIAAMAVVLRGQVDAPHALVLLAGLALAIAGAWLCGPLAAPGQLYAVPIAIGGADVFVGRGDDAVAAMLLLAAAGLAAGLRLRQRIGATALAAQLQAAEQAETIDALLLDQEAGAHGWIWETSAGNRLRNVDPALAAAVGLPAAAIEGALLKTIFAARAPKAAMSAGARAVRRALADRRPFRELLVEIATPDGPVWWRLSGKPLRDETDAFVGFRGIGTDVTVAHNTEARIAYLANYDSLTGLANRERFRAHVARECDAAARDGHWRAMLYLDLDGFKSVNDSLGHAAGDHLLKQVARRLEAAAPAEAVVARLGGDEFALWYPATPARAEALAQRLIGALAAPFDIEGTRATIAGSVGIAYTPKHAVSPDALFGKADLALYRAKADGKGVARTFVESDELAVVEKRKLDGDLKLALARGEFELHYQPLLDLTNGEVIAFEALIRWRSPTRGVVPPGDFIPAAESSGLIAAIGRWVLGQACRDAAGWPAAVRVAVNVSPKQFADTDFPRSVTLALQASGLDSSRLEVEVTEGVFLDHSATALAHLRTLREHGIRIALDDFGTGYSSLSYLTRYPVDKIKIDRSFVQNLGRVGDEAIVEAILTLARRLSIEVTAEGVETGQQALKLKARRCDAIQGFLVGRPRPNADVSEMLNAAPAALRAAIPIATGSSPLALALAARRQSA